LATTAAKKRYDVIVVERVIPCYCFVIVTGDETHLLLRQIGCW